MNDMKLAIQLLDLKTTIEEGFGTPGELRGRLRSLIEKPPLETLVMRSEKLISRKEMASLKYKLLNNRSVTRKQLSEELFGGLRRGGESQQEGQGVGRR